MFKFKYDSCGLVVMKADLCLEGHGFECNSHHMPLRCTKHGTDPTHCPLFNLVMG